VAGDVMTRLRLPRQRPRTLAFDPEELCMLALLVTENQSMMSARDETCLSLTDVLNDKNIQRLRLVRPRAGNMP